MTKIQLISSRIASNENIRRFNTITLSSLEAPKSLDEFDINVIDLSETSLWENDDNNRSKINCISDLVSLKTMIEHKSNAKVILVCPQNAIFCYHKSFSANKYYERIPIKDMITDVCTKILPKIAPTASYPLRLLYENTRTTLNEHTYEADFYFDANDHVLTRSNYSNKITTVQLTDNDVYATTLKVTESRETLIPFLEYFFNRSERQSVPDWMDSVAFGDDDEQRTLIAQKEREIAQAQLSIDAAKRKLNENDKYKSILYANGAELVGVVFDILEHLLECNLSTFEDKNKEDFLIETEEYTFIGEIKGVTSNVRSENISQIDNHYYGYLDNHPQAEKSEIHQLLIINPLRKQAPSEREPVNEAQIHLAERNGCLIIETYTLLKLFENYKAGIVTSHQCIEAFCRNTGLLKLTDVISMLSAGEE